MTPDEHIKAAERWAERADEAWFSDEEDATWAVVASNLAVTHTNLAIAKHCAQ